MITINNNIGNFEAYLISPDGENLGVITNVISLDDVRRQIKKECKFGYKIQYEDKLINIDKYGTLQEVPDAFCVHTDILLDLI